MPNKYFVPNFQRDQHPFTIKYSGLYVLSTSTYNEKAEATSRILLLGEGVLVGRGTSSEYCKLNSLSLSIIAHMSASHSTEFTCCSFVVTVTLQTCCLSSWRLEAVIIW